MKWPPSIYSMTMCAVNHLGLSVAACTWWSSTSIILIILTQSLIYFISKITPYPATGNHIILCSCWARSVKPLFNWPLHHWHHYVFGRSPFISNKCTKRLFGEWKKVKVWLKIEFERPSYFPLPIWVFSLRWKLYQSKQRNVFYF